MVDEKNKLSRITVDIPSDMHKKLKALAAISGKSMREVIIKSIEEYINKDNKHEDFFKKLKT